MENRMMMEDATFSGSTANLQEAERILQAQEGDLQAFNELVLSYQDRIFSLAASILGDDSLAEDITQNTFLAAYQNLPHFRNGSFHSWLYRIATNACYDELRRRKRRPTQSFGDEDEVERNFLAPYELPGHTNSPEKEYDRRELEQTIQHALDQLDTDQRVVIVLVDLQDLDYEQAAKVLGIPLGTVKSRLARARLQLKRLLTRTLPKSEIL